MKFIAALLVAFVGAASACDFPPSLWCSSKEISKLCKVEEHCRQHLASSGSINASPVNFALYYESLCPDCKLFFKHQLAETFYTLGSIMNLTLVPYGNAEVEDQCREHLTPRDSETAQLVNFGFYYESLCPFCKLFFKNNIGPAYNAIGSIMNITLVPFGNAEEKKQGDKYVFTCQHGQQECIGNVIETCAIYLLKDIKVYFPFISCMEASNADPKKAAKQCATKTKITQLSAIMNCADGHQGNQLEHQMAMKTDALQPDHQYVPWVTLNGVHTEQIQNKAEKNLIKLVCDTYKGPKPAACNTEQSKKRCQKKAWFLSSLPYFGKQTHDVL